MTTIPSEALSSAAAVSVDIPESVTPTRRAAAPSLPGWLRPSRWLPLTGMIVVLALLWWWASVQLPYLLPPLTAVGEALIDNPGFYLVNAWVTLQEALIGLAIAFVTSFILAILVSELPVFRRAVMPIAVVLNVTPLVAIAPALVVAFGFGPEPKLIVTAIICFFPILINVSIGLRSVPAPVLQFYSTIRASRLEMLWHVRIPSSLPFLFAALKIVFPLSIVGAVVAEMFAPGAAEGLGTAIKLASANNKLAVVYASIFVLALMGSALLAIVTAVERRVLHWHESHAPAKS